MGKPPHSEWEDELSAFVQWLCVRGALWLCGRVPDLKSVGCRFESQPGLLRTKVYSAFHPSGIGKWVPVIAGKAKAIGVSRLTPIADERLGVQVKLWDPLRTYVPYLSASAVVIHYEEVLYQVYAPLPYLYLYVECRSCNQDVAGSTLGRGYFTPRSTQPSIHPGSVNEYQLWLGRQR